jgi:hypothetical protein
MPPVFTGSSTLAPTAAATNSGAATPVPSPSTQGLSGGQIAGIVIGSVLGAALLLALIIFACVMLRKRRQSQAGSIFNQPSPARSGPAPQMTYTDGAPPAIVPGGRVARMSALEGSGSSSHHNGSSRGGIMTRESDNISRSSPGSQHSAFAASLPKRRGSLSSSSALQAHGEDPVSPQHSSDNGQFSSPEGVGSGQSEQLQFFKDYYSQDEIRPGDMVSTLWAYQPRANDEFELERGDMLKVVGIWDDGWATGIKLNDRADEWEARQRVQRDSGVSNGSRKSGVPVDGEIKAFPVRIMLFKPP